MPTLGNPAAVSPEMFASLRICLAVTLLVHIPVIGAVLGGAGASLLLHFIGKDTKNPRYLRFSREVIDTVLVDGKVLFILGFVPVPLTGLVLALILPGKNPLPWPFWILPSGGLVAAYLLLRAYRAALAGAAEASATRFLCGVAAFLAGTSSFFLFHAGLGTLLDPEKLPLLRERIHFLVSWNSFVKFHLFLLLFLGLAGAVILFSVLRRAGEGEPDPEYQRIVREWGGALCVLSAVGIPVLLLLSLASLPELALSAPVFAVAGAATLFSLGVVLVLRRAGEKDDPAPGGKLLALFCLILVAVLAGDQAAIGNAFRGRIASGKPATAKPAEPAAPKEKPAAAAPGAKDRGEELFGKICAGCHRFDRRVVGPPLSQVLPKYRGAPAKLKEFLRNPGKVDPDYPPMPNLGLSEEESGAIAGYLLEKMQEGKVP